jgi:hypothetical protein
VKPWRWWLDDFWYEVSLFGLFAIAMLPWELIYGRSTTEREVH